MTKRTLAMAAVLASMLAVGPSAEARPHSHKPHQPIGAVKPSPIVDVHIKSISSTEIKSSCPTYSASNPPKALVIRIDNLNLHSLGHKIEEYISFDHGNQGGTTKIRDYRERLLQVPSPTPLDIEAPDYLTNNGDYIVVEIHLNNPNIHFMNGSDALTAGDTNENDMFCLPGGNPINSYPGKIVFGVQYKSAKPDNTAHYGTFNIGLIVGEDHHPEYQTQIIIDPKVKNTGLD